MPAWAIDRFEKVASPLELVWAVPPVTLPETAVAELSKRLMLTPARDTGFPKRSTIWTVTDGETGLPATVSVGGCTKCMRLAVADRF